jgi:hypothetical protein
MKARSVVPEIDCARILPGFDFADAYQVASPVGIDAIVAADRMFAHSPGWVHALLALRNRLGALAALKPARAGRFPVLTQSPREVLMGFDDHHLDFRIAVVVDGGRATITTIVRTHNLLGRAYLAAIMPFHRMIAARAARSIALAGA